METQEMGVAFLIDYLCHLQVHEWGGVFTDIVTWSHFRQFRPGLRIAINSHGGHYWSTQVCFLPSKGST